MSDQSKRFLRFKFLDGTYKDIELKKATVLRGDVKKVMMHLDELEDGSFLLILNEKLTQDKKIDKIEVIRDDPVIPAEGINYG